MSLRGGQGTYILSLPERLVHALSATVGGLIVHGVDGLFFLFIMVGLGLGQV
jgi:hypothetical protein